MTAYNCKLDWKQDKCQLFAIAQCIATFKYKQGCKPAKCQQRKYAIVHKWPSHAFHLSSCCQQWGLSADQGLPKFQSGVELQIALFFWKKTHSSSCSVLVNNEAPLQIRDFKNSNMPWSAIGTSGISIWLELRLDFDSKSNYDKYQKYSPFEQ